MANAFAISRVTNVLSITGLKGQDLTLGTGTFGTALTFTSATGAATFAAPVTVTGLLATVSANSASPEMASFRNNYAGGPSTPYISIGSGTDSTTGARIAAVVDYSNNLGAGIKLQTRTTAGTIQDALTFATTRDATFAAGVTVSGSILGSGGSAPTSTTTGSNVFTAGIATSGPIFSGTLNTTGTNSDIVYGARFINTNAQSNAATGIELRGSNKSAYIVNITDGRTYFYTNAVAGQTAYPTETAWLSVASTGAATFAGNLTVSGSTFTLGSTTSQITGAAGNMTITAGTGNSRTLTLQTTNSGGSAINALILDGTGALTVLDGTSYNWGAGTVLIGGNSSTNAFFVRTSGSNKFSLDSAGVATFASTTSGTSTTTASVIAKSLALSENLVTGGGQGWGITSTATAGGTTVLTATSKVIQIFTGSAAQAVTLPAANVYGSTAGAIYVLKNRSTGAVTINRAGSDTIDAGTSYVLAAGANDAVMLVSDGVSSWSVT